MVQDRPELAQDRSKTRLRSPKRDPTAEPYGVVLVDGLTWNAGREVFEVRQLDGLTGSPGKEPFELGHVDEWKGGPRQVPSEAGLVEGGI